MPTAGFEPTISASERPQTYALGRAATGIGLRIGYYMNIQKVSFVTIDTVYLKPVNAFKQ
jgi:hypothetical protein